MNILSELCRKEFDKDNIVYDVKDVDDILLER